MPWWQGQEATRPPAYQSLNFSIQRQIIVHHASPRVAYNGSLGSRLQAGCLHTTRSTRRADAYGATLLNSRIDSPAAIAAGIPRAVPRLHRVCGAASATVRQALRPYPQFQDIDTRSGGGDHCGHSTYHSAMLRFEKRYSARPAVPDFVCLLEDPDRCRQLLVRTAPPWIHYNRGLEKSIGHSTSRTTSSSAPSTIFRSGRASSS